MNHTDAGFLLLTGKLGNPYRKPLTTAQLRLLTQRAKLLPMPSGEEKLTAQHLAAIGIGSSLITQILRLLDDEPSLNAYLANAQKLGCTPIARSNEAYPLILRKRLGNDAPGCLWAKGDLRLLKMPTVSLVGSRDASLENRRFAREVGIQAAKQGYALVSGNARGNDVTAQNACLEAGGCVISVVADELAQYHRSDNILYISEEDYDEPFSVQRALSRNRVIHAMGEIVFVAQCTLGKGGTWSGTVQNLKHRWSSVFCCRDQSPASLELEQMGAVLIEPEHLQNFKSLCEAQLRLF